ncbi:MAG: hypothetical protein QOD35_2355 [Nocardioidaceae bacterium]|nr:hypothetical protein [Nocardioidaceae bacterium]
MRRSGVDPGSSTIPVRGGSDSEQALEVTREVGLVEESDLLSHGSGWLSSEQEAPCVVQATAGEVAMWRHSVLAAETAHQIGRVCVQEPGSLTQAQAGCDPCVEQVAQLSRQTAVACPRRRREAAVEMLFEPLTNQGETRLRLELVVRVAQRLVEPGNAGAQRRVDQGRTVNRAADQMLVELVVLQVQHPLPEAGGGR